MNLERIHIIISGRVQGVGYRAGAYRKAMEWGLFGWVRNLSDSRVEIHAEGKKEDIEKFLNWCRRGPALSHVSHVEILEQAKIDQVSHCEFAIRRTQGASPIANF